VQNIARFSADAAIELVCLFAFAGIIAVVLA